MTLSESMQNKIIITRSESTLLRVIGETPRLHVHSYQESDYPLCHRLYSDEVITRYFDHGKPRTKEQIDAYIDERGTGYFTKGMPYGLFSVFTKDDKAFIGQVDLVPTGIPGEVEIGWIFFKDYQNQGYCSEAVKFFLMPLIGELIKLKIASNGQPINRVIATAHPENIPSQKMIAKCGLTFFKFEKRYDGNPRNWYELNIGQPQ